MSVDTESKTPWAAILSLAATVMVAFGVILYGFSIFVTGGAAGGEFSKTVLSIAYGGSVVSGGLLAIPVGLRADRSGVRGILLVGGLLAAAGMAIFAAATQPWHVLAAWWLFIGPAGAMTFYEVAFIAVDQWCLPQQRPRALGALTLIGGLAGIIFIPLTEWLVSALGWRATAASLGGLVLVAALGSAAVAVAGSPHATSPRQPPEPSASLRTQLMGDRTFVVHTIAMVLIFFAIQGIFAHRIAVFDEAGFAVATVALWAAAASAFSLPGRWIAPLLATKFRPVAVQAVTSLVLCLATLFMFDGSAEWQLVAHFVLFGASFGAFLPLRAMAMAGWFSGPRYGATMGSQWSLTTVFGAGGPIVVGLLRDGSSDYGGAVLVLVAALLSATLLLFALVKD
ncbi:MAG: MFS transporter [Acidimicrobiia bacterium]|nr:MFS transporter [Acidimicrobiia bacterium]